MPLVKGKSNKAVGKNIQTLVDDFQKSGRIGTSKPANKAAAVKQATAIALRTAGRQKPVAKKAGGKVAKYSNGGYVNEPTNYSVGNDPQGRPINSVPSNPEVQRRVEEERIRREMALGAAGNQTAEQRQAEEARETARFAPATNMPGAGDAQYQTYRRRPLNLSPARRLGGQMAGSEWTEDPDNYAVPDAETARLMRRVAGKPASSEADRRMARNLGIAMKKGGKVSVKKKGR